MKRLAITLTHGLEHQGLIDLQVAAAPGRPSRAAFFRKEDSVATDLSSIGLGDIRSLFWVYLWGVLWFQGQGERHCSWSMGHHQTARRV